jgi:hypothetical protein
MGIHNHGAQRRRQVVLAGEEPRVGRACEEKRHGETDECVIGMRGCAMEQERMHDGLVITY